MPRKLFNLDVHGTIFAVGWLNIFAAADLLSVNGYSYIPLDCSKLFAQAYSVLAHSLKTFLLCDFHSRARDQPRDKREQNRFPVT